MLDQIAIGYFSPGNPGLFRPLIDALLEYDHFMVLADYRPYIQCQERVNQAYGDQECWTQKSILNVARIGYFSSDRAIREYCEQIWKILPIEVCEFDLSF